MDRPTLAPKRRFWGWVLILSAVVLVLGPILYGALPEEIARWREAIALEKYLKGDLEGAIAEMDRSIAWYSENPQALVTRADYKLDTKDYAGAVEDFDRALEVTAETDVDMMVSVLIRRSSALHYLGRHEEAIRDLERAQEKNGRKGGSRYATILNNLAYARALGRQDIEKGLKEVKQAIGITGNNPTFLDTRGYLYYLNGDIKKSADDMERAANMAEQMYQRFMSSVNPRQIVDIRRHQKDIQQYKRHLAVILYHKALVLQQRGSSEDQDLEKAKKILARIRNDLGHIPGDQLF